MHAIKHRILNLNQVSHYVPQVAAWHHAEWGYLNPDGSLQQRIAKMQHYLGASLIPSMLVSVLDGQVTGSAALVQSDMDSHSELTPWLASVYVDKPYRQQGLASALVSEVMALAKAHDIATLYLFTPGQEAFYAKLGWGIISKECYRGAQVTVMQVCL